MLWEKEFDQIPSSEPVQGTVPVLYPIASVNNAMTMVRMTNATPGSDVTMVHFSLPDASRLMN